MRRHLPVAAPHRPAALPSVGLNMGDTDTPPDPPSADLVAVAVNAMFTTSIFQPGGFTTQMGVRIETPIDRAIATAYVQATLENDTNGDGVWVATLQAPVTTGPYNLVWRTSDAEPPAFEGFVPLSCVTTQAEADVLNFPPIDRASITPTVLDIANLERSRVVDANGNQLPTFQDSGPASSPATATDVSNLIEDGVDQVLTRLPDAINPADWPKALLAAKYATAVLVETSFFRVQGISPQGRGASGQSSNVFTYRTLYEEIMSELTDIADNAGEGMRLV